MTDLIGRIEAEIPALRRYARMLRRDAAEADDLVQDCLERALTRLAMWRREGNLRAWLFTIMHNVNANQMRALSRRPPSVPLDETQQEFAVDAPPHIRILIAETLDAVWKLSHEQREVLLLVAVEGLRYREVAAVTGVPIGTVMSRLARGRERLRELDAERPAPRLRRVI